MKTKNNNNKKTKRIRHRFQSIYDFADLWAQKKQDRAHCRNAFFEGDRIYSYGRHFCLGRLVEYQGQKIALLNQSKYSRTTSGHQSAVYWAASRAKLLIIETDSANIEQGNIAAQVESFLDNQLNDLNSRLHSFIEFGACRYSRDSFRQDLKQFNNVCNLLGFKELAFEVPKDFWVIPNDLVKMNSIIAKERNSRQLLSLNEVLPIIRDSVYWSPCFFGLPSGKRRRLAQKVA